MTDITTASPFPYWLGQRTVDLIDSADEYERAVNEGRFADDLDAGAHLLSVAADLRTEITRRQNEHWHPGSIRHSHPSGQEPHDHGGATSDLLAALEQAARILRKDR